MLPIWGFPGGTGKNRRFTYIAVRHRSWSAAPPNQPRDAAWLRRSTGDGRRAWRWCRWSAGSRSGRCRVLLELQPRSPIPAPRRFGAHGPTSHLGTTFRAYRYADEVLMPAIGTNGACHVNGRWSKAHFLVLSIRFPVNHACAYRRTLSTFNDSEASMLRKIFPSKPSLLKLMV